MRGLSFQLLDPDHLLATDSFRFVHEFLRRTGRTQIGWHYVVDLAWIHSIAASWPRPARILDAGGGRGPAQFLLAEMGFDIINIDLVHAPPGAGEQSRYGIRRVELGRHADDPYVLHLAQQGATRARLGALRLLRESAPWRAMRRLSYRRRHERWRRRSGLVGPVGSIELVQADLGAMPQVASASFAGVVSLSALEHIPLERLPHALAEIERVLEPDARVAITTSASADATTWYHAPSKGLCFSAADLQALFNATPRGSDTPAAILQRYRDCAFLRQNLASFYSRSGDNGMPWGRWDPAYIPVALWR